MKFTRTEPISQVVSIEARVVKAVNDLRTLIVCEVLLVILACVGFALGIWQELLSHFVH